MRFMRTFRVKATDQRCPMYQEHNRFYADWRDRKGVRHRRAFTTAAQAEAFELTQKALNHPKRKARRIPGQPSRESCSPSLRRKNGRTPFTTPSKASSRPLAQSDRATSSRSISRTSSRTLRRTRPPRATSTTPISARSFGDSRTDTERHADSTAKSPGSINQRQEIARSRRHSKKPS